MKYIAEKKSNGYTSVTVDLTPSNQRAIERSVLWLFLEFHRLNAGVGNLSDFYTDDVGFRETISVLAILK